MNIVVLMDFNLRATKNNTSRWIILCNKLKWDDIKETRDFYFYFYLYLMFISLNSNEFIKIFASR